MGIVEDLVQIHKLMIETFGPGFASMIYAAVGAIVVIAAAALMYFFLTPKS